MKVWRRIYRWLWSKYPNFQYEYIIEKQRDGIFFENGEKLGNHIHAIIYLNDDLNYREFWEYIKNMHYIHINIYIIRIYSKEDLKRIKRYMRKQNDKIKKSRRKF